MLEEVLGTVGGVAGRIVGLGLVLGAGIVIGHGMRPAAKTAMKGYLSFADRVKEFSAEASESIQDVYYEVKAEREQVTPQEGQSPQAKAAKATKAPKA